MTYDHRSEIEMSHPAQGGNLPDPKSEIQTIRGKQLWSLAALYGSILIGWIAYENYQPKLLVQFNFTEFAFPLAVTQCIILMVTPPIAGRFGDRYRFTQGHRIPIISAGMSFAAMVFMAVAFTLLSNPGETFRWILPVLIILWLTSMSIFTGPALSTIETFIPVEKLPKAMAILTIVGNLLSAIEPVIVDIIDYLGAPVTFITGGVLVFISGYSLKKNMLAFFKQTEGKETEPVISTDTQSSKYVYIFILGIMLGIASSVLINIFPEVFDKKMSDITGAENGKVVVVSILGVSALLSLPFSNFVEKRGLGRSFRLSILLTLVSMLCIFIFQSAIIILPMLLVFSAGFTFLSVSALPLAIQKANYYEKVFCVGIFFSGVALPDGFVNAWLL